MTFEEEFKVKQIIKVSKSIDEMVAQINDETDFYIVVKEVLN